mmetsp:Transcript_118557/g.165220  ORF Transcript_118557/g.165220 Transcript_118557/m.165220 type:complete len:83 (+) Transcript_118557:919-1167(+)
MYHKIDNKLVAVGVLTMTKTIINSDYFFYDPDYSFLHLGIVGAIREIEYIRMVNDKYNPELTRYQLSDMSITCGKINYKLNY